MACELAVRLGLVLLAALIESCFGYPDALVRVIGHPVTWMGALIGWLDAQLNVTTTKSATTLPLTGRVAQSAGWGEGRGDGSALHSQHHPTPDPSPRGGGERSHLRRMIEQWTQMPSCGGSSWLCARLPGILALLILLAVTMAIASVAQAVLGPTILGFVGVAILASTLLAFRSLGTHVRAVAEALDAGSLEAGRGAVSQIVGRDPETLDEAGVCRAAIESLVENFSDGVVAPALWLAVGGLPGIAAYKTINTADSMIGHRTPRHQAFGWAAARLDDLVNLPASRLTALLIVFAALVLPGASAGEAWRAIWRDAGKHRSPNAGWPEAAMAGALGLQLAGPRSYGGLMTPGTPMGAGGRTAATAADIRRALQLYRGSAAIGLAIVAVAILILSLLL